MESTTPPPLSAKAQDLLDKAETILQQVDDAHIFSVAKKTPREFPRFDTEEIERGPLLGKGGFSGVKEVMAIQLHNHSNNNNDKNNDKNNNNNNDKNHDFHDLDVDDEVHYELDTAKEHMAQKCLRAGSARYAIKKLKPELQDIDRARGALDLAIEIKYMSVIWHPNIVKMRAISNTPRLSTETFLLIDRLYGTLETKIEAWEKELAMHQGCCGSSKNNSATQELLKERLLVSYDLTAAFNYLHGLRLVYRDIKPENIGFDIRGDVKIFDFGLCKSLEKKNKVKNGYGYNLTKTTGSIPYMAPEVALGKPYGKECDVFSFGILLWEILSLEWAFNGFNTKEYIVRVCKHNERLPIQGGSWPVIMRTIIQEAWDEDPQKRPTMKRIGTLIRADLEDMTADASVVNRTEHMLNRSRRSQRLGMGRGSGSRHRRTSVSDRSTRESFVGDLGGSEIVGVLGSSQIFSKSGGVALG